MLAPEQFSNVGRVGVALLPDTGLGRQRMQKVAVFASETWSGLALPIQYAAIEACQRHSDFALPEKTQTLRLSTFYLDMETKFDPQRIFDLYKQGVDVKTLMSVDTHPATHAALDVFKKFILTIQS